MEPRLYEPRRFVGVEITDAPPLRPREDAAEVVSAQQEGSMPEVDERQVERQTYGNAPGWSQGQVAKDAEGNAVTPTAQEEASPAPGAESAPPAEQQGSEQGTPPTTLPEKYNVPPKERWDELVKERNEFKQLAELALQKVQPAQPLPPADDPWKGLVDHPDPATAQFYQQQRALVQKEAERMADQKLQGVLQAVDAGRRELATMKISQFRKENPDIKAGSHEETVIAGYVQQGFDLDSAKKLALYDTLEAENRALKSKQASIPQKRLANTERSSGMPQTAGLPPQPGDWRERAGEILDKGGSLKDVLGTVFGGKR